MAAGAAVRGGVRYGLTVLGISGLPLGIAAGAITGAMVAGLREARHQLNVTEASEGEQYIYDKKHVLVAALRGAAVGAVGGLIGYEIANLVSEHFFTPSTPQAPRTPSIYEINHPYEDEGPGGGGSPGPQQLTQTPVATLNPEAVTQLPGHIEPPATPGPIIPPPEQPHVEPPSAPAPTTPPETPLPPSVSALPDIEPLQTGSNIWDESADFLRAAGIAPTNDRILAVAKEVARESDVRVPEWGVNGHHLSTQLPPGYKLAFSGTKKIIAGFSKKTKGLFDSDEDY